MLCFVCFSLGHWIHHRCNCRWQLGIVGHTSAALLCNQMVSVIVLLGRWALLYASIYLWPVIPLHLQDIDYISLCSWNCRSAVRDVASGLCISWNLFLQGFFPRLFKFENITDFVIVIRWTFSLSPPSLLLFSCHQSML